MRTLIVKRLTDKERKSQISQECFPHLPKEIKGEDVNDKKCQKVTGHCYFPGKYRDATHSICNLKQWIKL